MWILRIMYIIRVLYVPHAVRFVSVNCSILECVENTYYLQTKAPSTRAGEKQTKLWPIDKV